ncbi:MAG: DUF1839 family protein [Gemmatimonadaceae bacterium]
MKSVKAGFPIHHDQEGPYSRHPLHGESCEWPGSNCYVDIWIEMLHSLGCDPLAMLPCTFGIDFESDQWTFFKPSHLDIRELYGIEVQELTVWRPLLDHLVTQLARGNTLIMEVDSWHLPDTAGTAYQLQHEKTSIAPCSVDAERRELEYFHNSSRYALGGDDFDGVFASSSFPLPPFTELVKLGRLVRHSQETLRTISLTAARWHFEHRPPANPFSLYAGHMDVDARWLGEEGMPTFHRYAFASLRQIGAGYSMAASYVRWLGGSASSGDSRRELNEAAEHFEGIAVDAKAIQFTLARSVARKKPSDFGPTLHRMSEQWDSAMTLLAAALYR